MIDITDKSHVPELSELAEYIADPLFPRFLEAMQREFAALHSLAYSGDKILWGWNLKFRKAGRALCVLYPKPGYFSLLIVVGQREKARVEAALCEMSPAMQSLYAATQEGMGQRWLLIDLFEENALYQDALRLMRIRRESGRA